MTILATMSSLFTDEIANLMCACFSANSRIRMLPEHVEKHSRSHSRHISYRLDIWFSQTISKIQHSLYRRFKSVLKIGREMLGFYIQKTTSSNRVAACFLY